MVICKSTDLYKTYSDKYYINNALINCNFEISSGECVAICGPKYSGKTTLLRLLGGLERPTNGNIYFNHNNISNYSDDELAAFRRKDTGYIYPNDSLIPVLTIQENIIMPVLLDHNKYNMVYYEGIIERLQLKKYLSYYPKQLSIKQRHRVICARALINNPSIILVDEPEDHLNHPMDKDILDFLLNMVYLYHKTLIMVTNDTEVSIYVDHIIRLKDGKVIEDRRIT